jgi:hypothetical protein
LLLQKRSRSLLSGESECKIHQLVQAASCAANAAMRALAECVLHAWSEWRSCDGRDRVERRSRSVIAGASSCSTPSEEHRPCTDSDPDADPNSPSEAPSHSEFLAAAEHDPLLARFKLYPRHDIGGYDTGANGGADTASSCSRRCLQHTKPHPCLAFTMPGCQSDFGHTICRTAPCHLTQQRVASAPALLN